MIRAQCDGVSQQMRQHCRNLRDKHAGGDGLDSASVASDRARTTTETEASLAERVVSGEKRALARCISLVENRDPTATDWWPSSSRRRGRLASSASPGHPG